MLTTGLGPVEGHLISSKKARTVVHFTYMLGEGRSEVEKVQKIEQRKILYFAF
jgi:hypothetical protein